MAAIQQALAVELADGGQNHHDTTPNGVTTGRRSNGRDTPTAGGPIHRRGTKLGKSHAGNSVYNVVSAC